MPPLLKTSRIIYIRSSGARTVIYRRRIIYSHEMSRRIHRRLVIITVAPRRMKENSSTVLRSSHCDVANIVIVSRGHKRDPHTEGALFAHRIQ